MKIEVRPSELHGRGVFATEDIRHGETVEIVPMLEIGKLYKGNILQDYVFGHWIWETNDKFDQGGQWIKSKNTTMLALGFGSIYNHSDNPNINYDAGLAPKGSWEFRANRAIKKDEELFINYGEGYWKSRKGKINPDK